jgi:hypothetical protein
MKLELFGKKFVVEFSHDTVDKWTTATLFEVVDGKVSTEPFAVGVAFCNYKDTFSRKVGRKVAYADLLEKTYKRLFKYLAWEEYFKVHPQDRKG